MDPRRGGSTTSQVSLQIIEIFICFLHFGCGISTRMLNMVVNKLSSVYRTHLFMKSQNSLYQR